jgi:Dolichyl-phosphate-mannose-protein mannosyltransferase
MNATHRPFIQNLKDIRIWIMLFFIVRLVGITNPPLETGHNWRQSLTSMITRNLSETGFDLLHPRIDMAGNESGIIGSEFPLFNAATYLCNETLGYSHWYGRLINLIVSSLGLWFFYQLIKRIFDSDTAFYSTLILAASIWFAFSRKTMPDTFSISLALGGLYYCSRFIDGKGQHNIFLYAIFMSAGILCKLPAMLWMTPVGIYILTVKMSLKNKIPVVIASAFILAAAFSWYFVWVPHLVSTYHYQLYFPK